MWLRRLVCKGLWWWPDPWTAVPQVDTNYLEVNWRKAKVSLRSLSFSKLYMYRKIDHSLSSSSMFASQENLSRPVFFLCNFRPVNSGLWAQRHNCMFTFQQVCASHRQEHCLVSVGCQFGMKNGKWIYIYWFYCILAIYFNV